MRTAKVVDAISCAVKMLMTTVPLNSKKEDLYKSSLRSFATRTDRSVTMPISGTDLEVAHVTVVADSSDDTESIVKMANGIIASAADSTIVLTDKTRFYPAGSAGSWGAAEDKRIREYLDEERPVAATAAEVAEGLIARKLKTLFVPNHPGHMVVATTDEKARCVGVISHRPDRKAPLLRKTEASGRALTVAYPELFGAQTAGLYKGMSTSLVEELNKIGRVMLRNPHWAIEMTIYPNKLLRWRDPAILERLSQSAKVAHPLYNLCSMAISNEEYEAIIKNHPKLKGPLDELIEASVSNLATRELVAPMRSKNYKVVAGMNCVSAGVGAIMGDPHAIDKHVVADPVVQVGSYQIAVFLMNEQKALELLRKTAIVDDSTFDLTAHPKLG